MKKLRLEFDKKFNSNWQRYYLNNVKIYVKGNPFFDNYDTKAFITSALFEDLIKSLLKGNLPVLFSLLNKLNGFYSIIIHDNDSLFATVDHVRSIPLFYSQTNEEIIITDNSEIIRGIYNCKDIDPISKKEFSLTGYVTGSETLFQKIKQLQAAEFLLINSCEQVNSLITHRFYRFHHTEPAKEVDDNVLIQELDKVAENCINRLIQFAAGRQIILPLSAGYDSRLLLSLLKRSGYDNILTFSYGKSGNFESKISKSVADFLNFKWEFVEYSPTLWKQWWNSEERKNYQLWASNGASIPHFQDWPAVWKMKESGKLNQNAIFVPGHTGDFISGGHIPKQTNTDDQIYDSDLINHIIKKHYVLNKWEKQDSNTKSQIYERIKERCEYNIIQTGLDLANFYEKWEWQERQAKFIINSVRVYEFWGYDWYLPLWDREMMNFWEKVPLHLRERKKLYNSMVENLHNPNRLQIGVRKKKQTENTVTHKHIFKRLTKMFYIYQMIRLYTSFKKYYNNPLGWYGIHNFLYYLKNRPKHFNSVITLRFLDLFKDL